MLQTMRMLQQALVEQQPKTAATLPSSENNLNSSRLGFDAASELTSGNLSNQPVSSSAENLAFERENDLNFEKEGTPTEADIMYNGIIQPDDFSTLMDSYRDSIGADFGLAAIEDGNNRGRSISMSDTISTEATSEPMIESSQGKKIRLGSRVPIKTSTTRHERKRRRLISDEDTTTASEVRPKTFLPRDKSGRFRPRSKEPEGVRTSLPSTRRRDSIEYENSVEMPVLSVVQGTPREGDDNSQIVDFRVRIPKEDGLHRDVISLLQQILREIRELNGRLADPSGAERTLEAYDPLAHRQTIGEDSVKGMRVAPPTLSRGNSQGQDENPVALLKRYIPNNFGEVRNIILEVSQALLPENQRNCKECFLPYSVQRNKDVLEFRCRNSQGHSSSVYGGRIPEIVLAGAWQLIQERGAENVFRSPKLSTRRNFKDRSSVGSSMPSSLQDVRPSPFQKLSPLYEDESQKYLRPEVDIKEVAWRVANELLPEEQRTCKVCHEPYSISKNKDALEFRCRNSRDHSPSLYGGRLPRLVMEKIYDTMRNGPVISSTGDIPSRSPFLQSLNFSKQSEDEDDDYEQYKPIRRQPAPRPVPDLSGKRPPLEGLTPNEALEVRNITSIIAADMLSIDQRSCKSCHEIYNVNRNKGNLEFRCPNAKGDHQGSGYGGRVPQEVVDRAVEMVKSRGDISRREIPNNTMINGNHITFL